MICTAYQGRSCQDADSVGAYVICVLVGASGAVSCARWAAAVAVRGGRQRQPEWVM